MKILFLIFFLFLSFAAFATNDLTNKQLLCPQQLWGFDFFASDRVKVIDTDINNKTKVTEYLYNTDLELSYINIFLNENNIRDRVYSIELNTLRVDIWTMTGGGITTREMLPTGFCEFVEINNIYSHIENLKNKL